MNQRVLYNFELIVGEKYYAFACQPGATFDDLDAVFGEFKKEFDMMKEKAMQAEAEAKATAEETSTGVQEAPVENAELVE